MRGLQKRRLDSALVRTRILPAWPVVFLVAALVIVIDQLTKSWARAELVDKDVEVFGPLEFALGYNRGVAFGLGDGVAPVLVTVAIAGFLFFLLTRRTQLTWPAIFAVGLVLGGALGNLADRLLRDTNGAVVDFIKVGDWWPVFNIADSCIVLGAVMLVLSSSRDQPASDESPPTETRSEQSSNE